MGIWKDFTQMLEENTKGSVYPTEEEKNLNSKVDRVRQSWNEERFKYQLVWYDVSLNTLADRLKGVSAEANPEVKYYRNIEAWDFLINICIEAADKGYTGVKFYLKGCLDKDEYFYNNENVINFMKEEGFTVKYDGCTAKIMWDYPKRVKLYPESYEVKLPKLNE